MIDGCFMLTKVDFTRRQSTVAEVLHAKVANKIVNYKMKWNRTANVNHMMLWKTVLSYTGVEQWLKTEQLWPTGV